MLKKMYAFARNQTPAVQPKHVPDNCLDPSAITSSSHGLNSFYHRRHTNHAIKSHVVSVCTPGGMGCEGHTASAARSAYLTYYRLPVYTVRHCRYQKRQRREKQLLFVPETVRGSPSPYPVLCSTQSVANSVHAGFSFTETLF